MNQGKLEVVKQEMARVNVDILGISELNWTGMGEFNSDDHYIYYCGQESLRRNGVAIMVNKRVQNAVKLKVKSLSHVQLFAIPWTIAYQAPLSMRFSRQEYWSGLPFPSPGDLPNPGIKPGLLHCRQILYHLNHRGRTPEVVYTRPQIYIHV